jgi:hypothetical protein
MSNAASFPSGDGSKDSGGGAIASTSIANSTPRIAGVGAGDASPVAYNPNFTPTFSPPYKQMSNMYTQYLKQYYGKYLDNLKKEEEERMRRQLNQSTEYGDRDTLSENIGYSNPYAIRQPQQDGGFRKSEEEEQTITLWDAMSGRLKKFPANMQKAQGDALGSSRDQNDWIQQGYVQASNHQRISQPSGGEDPEAYEIPPIFDRYVNDPQLGISKEQVDGVNQMKYSDYDQRKQKSMQDPTHMVSPYADHPAVRKHMDHQEKLQQIQQADQMNAQGGEQQQQPGGMPGMPPQGGMPGMPPQGGMPGMGGQGGPPPEMMQMMKQMMGGKGGPPQGGMPQMPPQGGMPKLMPTPPAMGGRGKKRNIYNNLMSLMQMQRGRRRRR